jgi:hypothetical protein
MESHTLPARTHRVVEKHQHPKHPRLTLELRSSSRFYQARTFIDSKLRQKSLKTSELTTALKLSEEWYRKELRASSQFGNQHPVARLTSDPTIKEVYDSYKASLVPAKRAYADQKWSPIASFWRALLLKDITAQTFRDFYQWRRKSKSGVSNHTLHKDVVLVRQVLKYALENDQLSTLPTIPKIGKIAANPRPWLEPDEWRHLRLIALARIEDAENVRTKQQRESVFDMMRFMVTSMVRVDELLALRFGDCRIAPNEKKEKILICDVTGKTGSRQVVALPEAAEIYAQRFEAAGKDKRALIFPEHHRDGFRALLESAGLYRDAKGFTRNFKSLRATAISFAVLAGVDLLKIARNAGTSLAMIDAYYAKRLTPLMSINELTAHAPVKRRKGSVLHRFRT